MICEECQYAGDANALGMWDKADRHHEECEGDCTCQHKVGSKWSVKKGQKVSMIRLQSP